MPSNKDVTIQEVWDLYTQFVRLYNQSERRGGNALCELRLMGDGSGDLAGDSYKGQGHTVIGTWFNLAGARTVLIGLINRYTPTTIYLAGERIEEGETVRINALTGIVTKI